MFKKLVISFILYFCFESFAFAAKCGNNELKVIKSNSPRYKVGSCLGKGTVLILKAEECLLLKHNNSLRTKKCGPYSDKGDIDKEEVTGIIHFFIEKLIRKMLSKNQR